MHNQVTGTVILLLKWPSYVVCKCFESHISVLKTNTNYYNILSAYSDTVVAIKSAGLDYSFAFLG